MPTPSLSRLAGWFSVLTLIAATSPVRAQTAPVVAPKNDAIHLDHWVVSASRTPQDRRFTPSSVTALSLPELRLTQIDGLKTALAQTPGVIVVSTGATGGQTSIFMRGANADQVLFLVDGVRMNTTQADYLNFLGGADLAGLERLEVLRGPQSTLYGSSAMGGVIAMETAAVGAGQTTGVVAARVGSFDTRGATVAARGRAGGLGYSASFGHDRTDNRRPDNAHKQSAYTLRFEDSIRPTLALGATLRGQVSAYDEAGSLLFPGAGRVEALNHLATTYAQWRPVAEFRSRLTAGWHQKEYTYTPKPYGSAATFYSRNTRRILDWQNSWDAAPWVTLVAGANAEWSHYISGGAPLQDRLHGAYLSTVLRPLANLSIDGGFRTDDYDLAGRATTGRAGVAYRVPATGTKFRATYGTGFKAPSGANRFGSLPFYAPSPTIRPEKSTGWDAGFDQALFGERLTVGATFFQSRFRDMISNVFQPATGLFKATNLKLARTEGVEFALAARPVQALTLRAAYTYLSALDTSAVKITRLARRPRHTLDLSAHGQATTKWLVGAGLHSVSDRVQSATVALENYATVRLHTSYALTPAVAVKFRVENALNETYAEVLGYPALPRALFGSVEWKF
jgi:vitamin B12 transporter